MPRYRVHRMQTTVTTYARTFDAASPAEASRLAEEDVAEGYNHWDTLIETVDDEEVLVAPLPPEK